MPDRLFRNPSFQKYIHPHGYPHSYHVDSPQLFPNHPHKFLQGFHHLLSRITVHAVKLAHKPA